MGRWEGQRYPVILIKGHRGLHGQLVGDGAGLYHGSCLLGALSWDPRLGSRTGDQGDQMRRRAVHH